MISLLLVLSLHANRVAFSLTRSSTVHQISIQQNLPLRPPLRSGHLVNAEHPIILKKNKSPGHQLKSTFSADEPPSRYASCCKLLLVSRTNVAVPLCSDDLEHKVQEMCLLCCFQDTVPHGEKGLLYCVHDQWANNPVRATQNRSMCNCNICTCSRSTHRYAAPLPIDHGYKTRREVHV